MTQHLSSIAQETANLLRQYATWYETEEFLKGDPSWFMHQVEGGNNQEAMALVTSVLSYGSRPVFMSKVETLLHASSGEMHEWIMQGEFQQMFRVDDNGCFYRFYTNAVMSGFLNSYRNILQEYGSLGTAVAENASDGYQALIRICELFNAKHKCTVIPKDTTSACKRLCMFLRWMVRDNSPVDLGLWAHFIDRRTLIIPFDTHVLQQSSRLGLLKSTNASMSTAKRLTSVLAEVFPDDPLRGDFALFGYGVNHKP